MKGKMKRMTTSWTNTETLKNLEKRSLAFQVKKRRTKMKTKRMLAKIKTLTAKEKERKRKRRRKTRKGVKRVEMGQRTRNPISQTWKVWTVQETHISLSIILLSGRIGTL